MITEFTRFERPRAWAYENGGPVSVVLTVTRSRRALEERRDQKPAA